MERIETTMRDALADFLGLLANKARSGELNAEDAAAIYRAICDAGGIHATVRDVAGVVSAVAASFILSYAALWVALILDGLAVLYNTLYETITETNTGAPSDPEAGAGPPDQDAAPGPDEVPTM